MFKSAIAALATVIYDPIFYTGLTEGKPGNYMCLQSISAAINWIDS